MHFKEYKHILSPHNGMNIYGFCKQHGIAYGSDKIFGFLRELPEESEQISLF